MSLTKKLTTITLVALVAAWAHAAPAQDARSKRQQYVATLQGEAPMAEKAIACKWLAIYGDAESVPAIAPLLLVPELSSWARIALEAIPGPAADAALRDAMGKAQGRILVGIINSIAVRRDAQAVEALVAKLKDAGADADVASAAAVALGRIGGDTAAAALVPALSSADPAVRSSAAEGAVLAAERYLAAKNAAAAIRLYDAVRNAPQLPRQRVAEATRGAILARGDAGIPLLVEQLRSGDVQTFALALRVARELPGNAATDAVMAELSRNAPERQALIIYALADRGDARILPVVLETAKSGSGSARVAAVTVLERYGNVASLPVLLEAAASDDKALSAAARTTLARLGGEEVDKDLFARLQTSSGATRRTLVELVEQRRMDGSLPVFLQIAGTDADASVREAAYVALGALGDEKHLGELLKLLQQPREAGDRGSVEKAINAIASRSGAACVPALLPAAASGDANVRVAALRALANCGGAQALGAIRSALSAEEQVADEAVRLLSTWPNRWPDDSAVAEPLLELARSGRKPAHKVLGLRGYLQHVQADKKLSADRRLEMIDTALTLAERADEKRLAISALANVRSAGAVQRLTKLADEAAVADEACAALVSLAGPVSSRLPRDVRRSALQTVIEKTKNDNLRNQAKSALEAIR